MLSLLLKLKENAESLAVKLRQVLGGVDPEELQAVLLAAYGPFEAQISRSAILHASESPFPSHSGSQLAPAAVFAAALSS